MENASKALLIAASVLIVILLVAFGMKIFNSAKSTNDSIKDASKAVDTKLAGDKATQQIEYNTKKSFNSKFEKYVGVNKSKSQAKGILETMMNNNNDSSNKKVYLTFLSNGTTSGAIYSPQTIQKVINGESGWGYAYKNKPDNYNFTIDLVYADGYVNLIKLY